MLDTYYPLPAFYFRVSFTSSSIIGGADSVSDTSFQEVSGISAEMETEVVNEGGNAFPLKLPKSLKYTPLILKRGMAAKTSDLVAWCHAVLNPNAMFYWPIRTMSVLVSLMDDQGNPYHSWTFVNAYPVKWEVDGFNSTKNEVAIEKIELHYDYFTESTSAADMAAVSEAAADTTRS